MNQKTVYQIDSAGHFRGQEVADESPREPGVWIIPARCVETAPPSSWPDSKWPRWDGSRWQLITKPSVVKTEDPAQKLAAFLAANPDVQELISNAGGV